MWARVFGHGEADLRSLSALCGVLAVPVAYLVATRLLDRRAGLIVAALTACNPLLIWLPAALVLAAGLAMRRCAPLGIAVAVALRAIGVTAAVGVGANRNLQRPDWRYVARALDTPPPRAPASPSAPSSSSTTARCCLCRCTSRGSGSCRRRERASPSSTSSP